MTPSYVYAKVFVPKPPATIKFSPGTLVIDVVTISFVVVLYPRPSSCVGSERMGATKRPLFVDALRVLAVALITMLFVD